jgi:transposase
MNSGAGELDELATRLRTRVAEGRYREAQDALREYCRALRAAAAGLPRGSPELARLEDRWRRLERETRRRVLAGRAQTGARLARLSTLTKGYGEIVKPRSRLEWLA